MKLSIRWKLILAIIVPLTAVYGGFLVYQFNDLRDAAYQQAMEFLQEHANHSAIKLDSDFHAAAGVAHDTAAFLVLIGEISEAELDLLLRANVGRNPFIFGSCIAFEPGAFPGRELYAPYVARNPKATDAAAPDALRSMDIAADAYDYRTWEWYSRPKELGHAVWTEPYFDEGAGNVVMSTCSVPFYKAENELAGIATIDIQLDQIQRRLQAEGLPGSVFAVVSREGRFISNRDPDYIMEHTIFTTPRVQRQPHLQEFGRRVLSRDRGVELITGLLDDDKAFVAHAIMPSTGWHFRVGIPEERVMRPVLAQLRAFALTALASLALIIATVLFVAIRITRPVRQLSAELQRIGEGNLESQLSNSYPSDEIGQLAATFREMVAKLRNYVEALTREAGERAKIETDLRIARNIQESLVPQTFPPFPDRMELDLHAILRPARQVGGDFYDFFFISPDELMIAIADVSGKGVPAALLMAVTRTLMRNLASAHRSPSEVLAQVNKALALDNRDGYFVTAFIGYYHARTGVVRFANAGHPPPLILRADGKVAELGEGTGPLLGIFEEGEYTEDAGILSLGDALVLFTDGVSEATSPADELYGDERLAEFVGTLKGNNATAIGNKLADELELFEHGNQADDLTLLILKRT